MAEADFAPKTISNYAQVVKMVVGSAIGDDGEELYPRKMEPQFIDLPDVAGPAELQLHPRKNPTISLRLMASSRCSMHCCRHRP